MVNFKQTTALITGGSSGIGLATAQALAAQGVRVFLNARRADLLAEALASLPPVAAGPHGILPADVSDLTQAQQVVADVTRQAGQVDLLLTSAGILEPGYVQDLPDDIFRKTMDVNYLGTVYVVKAVLPQMIARHAGHIITVGSLASRYSVFGYSAYAPSKFAVRGFTDALRMEMKALGVKVSIVYPPDTDTPQLAYEATTRPLELKYMAETLSVLPPQQVAAAIVRGIQRNQYEIVPDLAGKATIYLDGILGALRYPLFDFLLHRARQRIARERNQSSER